MKPITRYESWDGCVFDSEEECRKYEMLLLAVERIMEPLGKIPKHKGCDFENGEGYLPHTVGDVIAAKAALVELGRHHLNIKSTEVGFYNIGRYFDDNNVSCLYHAWSRLYCCDEKGREWGQAYFASHPNEGKQHIYKGGRT